MFTSVPPYACAFGSNHTNSLGKLRGRQRGSWLAFLASLSLVTIACDSDDEDPKEARTPTRSSSQVGRSHAPDAGDGDTDASTSKKSQYAFASLVSAGEDESLTYFKILDALEPQEIDFDNAREFSGMADVWVYDGSVFITNDEELTVTRYEFEDGELVEGDTIGFSNFGVRDIGFWLNMFLSPTKAYFVNAPEEYIVWNPKTMEITGTVDMPKLEKQKGLEPYPSYSDRSVAIRDGLLYHPYYFTDEDFFRYTASSPIAVYDVETDELVRVIEAPCPGIDQATRDDDGNLYFSSWVYAPGAAAILDQPATCVAKIAKDEDEATVAFNVKDVTDGREGGVFRVTGPGKGILSVLHPEHEPEETRGEPSTVTFGGNWRFWSYDFASGTAERIEALDWNAGAAYASEVDGKSYALIPGDDYMSTTAYDITTPSEPAKVFETPGWMMRLVALP